MSKIVSNNKKNNKKATLSEVFTDVARGITGIFVFIILVVFPLYTHDMYFDILGARYVFYKIWGITLVVLLSLTGILYLILDYQNHSSEPCAAKRFISSFKPANIKKHIIVTDIFFFAMLIVCIVSTILSDFKEESFFGSSGRYQGLECWIIYFITYVAITRTFKFKLYHFDFALLAGCFACIWGTMDFFMMDPFGFFRNVNATQKAMFASSIGNLNTYTNYTIIIFALGSILFIIEDNKWKMIFYFITSLIGCIGCVFGLADNTVLGFFAFYLFVPFFTFKTRKHFIKYLITIDVLFITTFLFWLSLKAPTWNKGQSSFFRDLVAHKEIAFVFIPLTIIIIIVAIIMIKMKPNYSGVENSENNQNLEKKLSPLDSALPKQFKNVYTVIVIIGFITVTYILLDMNIFKQHVDIWKQLPSSNQLVFNDYWGTHRGHNWRIAFTNFTQNFSPLQRLFGYGPDTYLVVSERTFYKEMVDRFGEVYDSAHNEYINYLICEGILGLISYLGIFISGLLIASKYVKKNKYLLACIIPVICYMVQAFVNIAIPITTPVFFTLMYLGVAYHFECKKSDV